MSKSIEQLTDMEIRNYKTPLQDPRPVPRRGYTLLGGMAVGE